MWSYLWQNFLNSQATIAFIVKQIENYKLKWEYDTLFEVGPWKAALTKHIIPIFNQSFLFEKDETFIDILTALNPSKIYWWDVLEQDLNSIVEKNSLANDKIMIVWNIPYYITSPILRKFFVDNCFKYWIFMIQKEVWEKIRYDADKKSFLRWLLNYAYKVEYLKTVPARFFNPKPKVDSCLVQLTYVWPKNFSFDKMFEFIDNFSSYKRKTLGKISKMLEKKDIVYKIPDSLLSLRIEDLDWEGLWLILDTNLSN